jgi:hypothetical protein
MSTNETRADSSRYGDFPELFWDADPAALIDVGNPTVLARLLTRGNAQLVGRMVPLELLQKELDSLQLPEHARTFWQCVLHHVPAAEGGRIRRPA